MKRGIFVEIEGTDGSGKETQSKKLIELMKSRFLACDKIDFPQYDSPSGRIVGQCYLGKDKNFYGWQGNSGWFEDPDRVDARVACAYYAADRRMSKPFIEGNLNKGVHVITDRYVDANKGHQGGKIEDKEERLKLYKDLDVLEHDFMQLPKPDLVIFLHMPTDVSLELKKKFSRDTSEGLDGHENNIPHLRRSEQAYLELSDLYNWIKIECAPDGTIASLKTPDEIHAEIWDNIKSHF
jgi:dTMP kinase